jgi:tRNA (cmo5U34)-methyltransferase
MSEFEKSRWADREFSQNYRDEADIYLPFRHQFIALAKSLYGHFTDADITAGVLDLGCGDGCFMEEFLNTFAPARVTLIDGSAEMLEAAKNRLIKHPHINFIRASFQDLLAGRGLNDSFTFIFSSLAIHHLPFQVKTQLYGYIYNHLSPNGFFALYDVVVPPSGKIEEWYLSLWKQWIKEHSAKDMRARLLGIPEQYKGNPDNMPDTLGSQMDALKKIGFKEVDCYCKHGIFSLFGGFK